MSPAENLVSTLKEHGWVDLPQGDVLRPGVDDPARFIRGLIVGLLLGAASWAILVWLVTR